jgi:hypothetical protein
MPCAEGETRFPDERLSVVGLTNIVVVSENFSVPEGAMKPYLQSFFNITFESDGELRINAVSS